MRTFKTYVNVIETSQMQEAKIERKLYLLSLAEQCGPNYSRIIASLPTPLSDVLFEMFMEGEGGKRTIMGNFKGTHHSEKKRRSFSDWEFEKAAELTRKKTGKKERLGGTLHQILQKQAPIVDAWKELGLDASPEEVRDFLKSNNVEISDPSFIKFATIDLLKKVREKVHKGEALATPQEREAYRVWSDMAQKQPGYSGSDPSKIIHPDYVYDELEKQGVHLVNPDEVELQLINKVKEDVSKNLGYTEDPDKYGKDPQKAKEAYQKQFERSVKRWRDSMGKTMDTDEPDEDPYISIDYHGSKKGASPEINAKYFVDGRPTDLFYHQIVRPVCLIVNQSIINRMKQQGLNPGDFHVDPDDRTSLCGCDNSENDNANKARYEFLDGQETSDIVQTVIQMMLNSTAIPGWEEYEGIRMNTARYITWRVMLKIREKQLERMGIEKGEREKMGGKHRKGVSAEKGELQQTGSSMLYQPHAPEEPEDAENNPQHVMDRSVLQHLLHNPEALNRMKSAAAAAPPEQRKEMEKIIKSAEDQLRLMQQN